MLFDYENVFVGALAIAVDEEVVAPTAHISPHNANQVKKRRIARKRKSITSIWQKETITKTHH